MYVQCTLIVEYKWIVCEYKWIVYEIKSKEWDKSWIS